MKKIYNNNRTGISSLWKMALFIWVSVLLMPSANAQINVNPGAGSYATLKLAFDAINAGTHTGAITIDVVGDTSESAPAVLNGSGSGAASYSSILISPSGGAVRTISGAIAAGSPLIDLNGADNVTINGLNTGGNSLVITNTRVSATTGTGTIRFQTDAVGNLITNCSILGSATMAVGTNGGNISFASAAVTTGNDNNTVSYCNIGPAGTGLPSKAIHFSGTSNTNPGTANNGILIDNNNIFDYFSPTVSSAGIDLNSGSTNLTISNNKFYQTATRTMTTASLTHSGIRINNTSGNAYQIIGNVIGFASNAGTGVYSIVTLATSPIIPINLSVGSATATSVQGNTVKAITISGSSSGTSSSGAFRGIYIGSGLTTVGDISGNTIGDMSATGSITYTSSATSTSDVIGIFNFGSNNWVTSNNAVGGITVSNSSTGAANLYGIRCNTGSAVTWLCNFNTIGGNIANSMLSNSTATGTIVIGILNSNPIGTFRSNTIRNLSAAGGTGTTTTASVVGMVMNATSANQIVGQNNIYNLSNTNATAATVVTGIQMNGSTTNAVERNLIYDLTVASNSASAEVNGIRVAGGTTTYRNNMIRLGNGIANAVQVNGFNEFLGTNTIFHNSIYIDGNPAAGSSNSFAFNGSQTVNVRSFRNNIFFNARSNAGATGKNYAVKVGGTGVNPTGLTVNNNVYFANGTGSFVGLYGGADHIDLAAWQAAVGQDANSIVGDPLYVSTTDLNLQAGSPAIDVAALLGVANDFAGESRPGLNALVDIGADEKDGIPIPINDIQATAFINPTNGGSKAQNIAFAPQASFTNNGTANQTNITVRYRIFDPASVQVYNQTFIIPSLASFATTTVTFPNATLTSLGGHTIFARAELVGDTVLSNDEINGTLNILGQLSGTYTVGTAGNYPSLTNAGGIFDAINNLGATSNLTINIISDLTGELGTHALNEIAGSFTTLIQPTGAARTVTGSNIGALIKLNGADNVTINGSTAGANVSSCLVGGDAVLRELTIQNTNVGTSACVLAIQTGTNGAQNNTIKNVNILGQDPTTTLLGISVGGNTPGSTGADNDNIIIENCSIQRSIFGIYAVGTSFANQNIGNIIRNNDLSATGSNRVRRVGVLAINQSAPIVSYNSVYTDTNEGNDGIGIGVGTQGVSDANVSAGGVTGATVSNNRITGVISSSTTGFSAAGIAVAGDSGAANVIMNNMISGVSAPSTSPDIVAGIFVAGVTGSSTKLFNNTVHLSGDRGAVASQIGSFAVAISGTDPNVELKNNIFSNTQTSTGGINAKSYAIGLQSTAFVNLDSNYNDFVSSGLNDAGFKSGSLNTTGTEYATLALWQAAVADDANSVEIAPVFVSATDLHLDTVGNPTLDNLGIVIAAVTQDFDCAARSLTTPDMGADEFTTLSTNQFTNLEGFKAYPNPTTNILNVEYTSEITKISVANMLGQQVMVKNASATNTQVDMSNLNAGMYLVTVEAGNVSKTIKVVKK